MPATAKELIDKRAKAITSARAILDKAEAEKRANTAEENVEYDKWVKEAEECRSGLDALEKRTALESAEQELAEQRKKLEGEGRSNPPPAGQVGGKPGDVRDKQVRAAFRSWMRDPGGLNTEQRGLLAGSDASGGLLVMPLEMMGGMIEAIRHNLWIYNSATVIQLPTAESVGMLTEASTMDDATWHDEIQAVAETDAPTFGRREMTPKLSKKLVKISTKLIRQATVSVENYLIERLARVFAVTEEKAFLTGTGVGRPLGVFTLSDHGLPTDRDVSTGNTATAVTPDGLLNAKYALYESARASANWTFHRLVLAEIYKLKDGDGKYLWQPSLTEGAPDRLLGLPVRESEYAPSTMTASQYVGVLANWRDYAIVERSQVRIQRLTELFSLTGQVGFIAEREVDGGPVRKESFVRVKLGS